MLNCYLSLNCLNFGTLYSRRHIEALFLTDIYKVKVNYPPIMNTWYSFAYKANKMILLST